MNYLLDTSSFLWFVNDDNRLSEAAMKLLEGSENSLSLSIVSVWETAIKANLGRGLELPIPFAPFIDAVLERYRFPILHISVAHLKRVAELPLIHRDPFDRLLIAQSLVEGLPILTSDRMFDAYAIQRIW